MESKLEEQNMWCKISSILIALIVIAVSGNFCFAACPRSDLTGDCRVDLKDLAVMASEWLTEGIPVPEGPPGMEWVQIDDPGIPDHEGFDGYVSKYETTNAQYCWFLNEALASGDITVDGSNVKGANGSNSGADFVGELYYYLTGPGYTYNGATNGGAARINWTGSSFTVDSGFEDHPVTYVSWYGSRAFCDYYGWRLPTEWEWQAVADYDGSYTYGCGASINNSIANYYNSTHPDGTTEVGAFGDYGYGMCDMAGNVWEWMENWYDATERYRCLRGGSWVSLGGSLRCSCRDYYFPGNRYCDFGFRVVFSQS
jgi:formylglycine-generating enzyme required for sulfatase activity